MKGGGSCHVDPGQVSLPKAPDGMLESILQVGFGGGQCCVLSLILCPCLRAPSSASSGDYYSVNSLELG